MATDDTRDNWIIPPDVEVVSEDRSSAKFWVRKGVMFTQDLKEQRYYAYLGHRKERQALPRGSSPLMAFGGRCIDGEDFTAEEVRKYIVLYNLDPNEVCIFEFTRNRV